MAETSMKEMLEAGVHFGHQTHRWNPKMAPFIFTSRNNVHIFDLAKTQENLQVALEFVENIVKNGGTVLYVGTKKQAKEIVKEEALNAGMPYITNRWLGGLLTNFSTIFKRVSYYKEIEKDKEEGKFDGLSKKDAIGKQKELDKLKTYLGGVKDLKKIPDAIFVVDTGREELAVREANRLKIPVIGIVDSNCNPDPINYVIPGNDDAVKAIKYIVSSISRAVAEGQGVLKNKEQMQPSLLNKIKEEL